MGCRRHAGYADHRRCALGRRARANRAPATTVLHGAGSAAESQKHLLSGLIRCSCCGAAYTVSGKDDYCSAGQKERDTCTNTVSVRKAGVETATLAIPQGQLFIDEQARIFVDDKVAELRVSLDEETVCGEAAEILSCLIESLTTNSTSAKGAEAEIVAKVQDLAAFATNENPPVRGTGGCSTPLVAGTGFEPVTFRL
ncbi:recombinase zinc beta ribbon domain-containing protein [Sphingomonas donggukensis]|uniref:recombinase zinc beta ribbon domain-containing protein n=1 Tax=Sphingomonas donggukensis TaxID=2949093 RepID=UPI003BF4B63A